MNFLVKLLLCWIVIKSAREIEIIRGPADDLWGWNHCSKEVLLCLMASSIYFNVLLHCNFPHQKGCHLFNFQEDELVILHNKIRRPQKKTLQEPSGKYRGGKTSLGCLGNFTVYYFLPCKTCLQKQMLFFLPKFHPHIWWSVLMAVRSFICGLSLTAGEWSGAPAKSLGLPIWWITLMKTEVALKSVICVFKINFDTIVAFFFFASSKWC